MGEVGYEEGWQAGREITMGVTAARPIQNLKSGESLKEESVALVRNYIGQGQTYV